ncbi:MAG: bifunctional folylpolyglutamate synthase/dihydrofolate synthase [Pyrinomonadaceae bacterium]
MNFIESLDYLYGLGYELSVRKFGLENTFALLNALENPEKNYLKIQIAGTNGKGSTCAFLESICLAADIKAGKYTSPHLISITERICVDGSEISENKFAEYATVIRNVSEKLVEDGKLEALPTFFEQVTSIALKFFADEKIEIAILETGLGGRFDSTTAAKAEIVAFTPIDFDHQHILGNTLKEIASEKAAIIRPDTKVFSTEQSREAKKIIYGKCRESGVEPVWAIPNVRVIEDLGFGIHYLSFQTKLANYKPDFWMQGRHQWTNATLAIYIAESLSDFGFKISRDQIETGIEQTRHQGRLEFLQGILFDGAHNISGAKALREYLDEFIKQPITMIFGTMKEKDLTETGEILFPKAEKLILTKPDNPRAMEISELKEFVPAYFPEQNLFLSENVIKALKKAKEISHENDLILVTGSLYLVGEVQKIVQSESEI